MPATSTSKLDALISPECQEIIRREIDDVHGAEVFFVGRLDANLVVEEVEAYAFGNRRTVPALLQYAQPGDVMLHNHPSGALEPSSADIEIASVLGERGVGSYIINNDCTEIRIVVKAMRPKGLVSLDVDGLAEMLSPGGRIASSLEGYEFRPQQIDMLRAITKALNEDSIAVIEAGTGTGKSMAYLLPAIAWSLKNNEKVVVSTHTINLQEQLIEKDLPLLKNTLGFEFDAVLVKGRNNYLCKRKTEYVRTHPEFQTDGEKRTQMEAIQTWARTTRDGSLSDLSFQPDSDVWEQVMSESDNCLRTQCPFYQSCFFYNSRRRASRANVLVVNHHLLMADLAVRAESNNYTQAAVLPPFHRVIFDEAHHLDEVATSYFGSRVSRGGMVFTLRRLFAQKTGAGLLHFLAGKIHEGFYQLDPDNAKKWMYRLSVELMDQHREFRDAIEEGSDRIAMALDELEGGRIDKPAEIKKRITDEIGQSPLWLRETVPALKAMLAAGRAYLESLREVHRTIHETVVNETPETMSPLLDLRSTMIKIEQHLSQLVRFLSGMQEDCRWIEYRRRGIGQRPILVFCAAPLEIADDIRNQVLRRFRTVVMTSATLTVEKKFNHFLEQIGAGDSKRLGIISAAALAEEKPVRDSPKRLETLMLDPVFDFDRQVYIGVPIDLPTPKENDFAPALDEFLAESLRISRGRGLVLFTSYALLQRAYDHVAPRLEALGYPCLKQGSAGRTLLTEAFRRDIGSILFATSSFWEGVDIPGEALSCLVLTRLPFAVPGEPIIEARIEALRERGLDPFEHLIVPRAVIRFRQGFGRLIRTKEDRGAVLICDQRVATQRYGQIFLRSLPTRRVHVAPREAVYRELGAFFSPAP